MREIRFGKNRFHENADMGSWLTQHLGPGGWYKQAIDDGHRWAWSSAFGNTFYYFRDDKDATFFLLRWG